jgi:hypothetical protein
VAVCPTAQKIVGVLRRWRDKDVAAGRDHFQLLDETIEYVAAVTPDVVLGLLDYIEALERR